jgi:hypothetical protein
MYSKSSLLGLVATWRTKTITTKQQKNKKHRKPNLDAMPLKK